MEIHEDSSRFKVLDIGRRGGKTELVLNELIKQAVKTAGLYFYVAPSYRQAKSIAWVRLKTLLAPARDYWKFNEQELYAEEKNLKTRIELKGADNEESLLGVGLKGVVFDESSMIRESAWTRIVRPMLAESQGWAIFISTPKGRNWFYDLYMRGVSKEQDWKSWHFPTSINQYIPKSEIDEMKRDMSERLFRQEIMAEFLDDETGVFKGIKKCITGEFVATPVVGRFYIIGIDLAKAQDFTCITVIDSVTRHVVAWERFNQISWTEQKFRIQNMAGKYNNALCIVDATGLGDPVVEDLQRSNISIEGFKFTNTSKFQLIDNLAIALEQRLITFPSVEILIDELQNYEYSITHSGKIQYSAPEGKHDDCVISLALAVWGIRSYLREAQVIHPMVDGKPVDKQGQGELVSPEYEYSYTGY